MALALTSTMRSSPSRYAAGRSGKPPQSPGRQPTGTDRPQWATVMGRTAALSLTGTSLRPGLAGLGVLGVHVA